MRIGIAATMVSAMLLLTGCAPGSTGVGLNLVSDEQVQSMGLDAWQSIRAETPQTRNSQMQRRAEKVAANLLQAAGRNPAEWDVVVFQGADSNAFALPGRKIGVYEGMMGLADTDAELAAVIGHEIAHVDADHSTERVNSHMATQAGTELVGAVLGSAGIGSPGIVEALLGAGAQYGILLPYSRNQELEADRLGLRYMAQAGYDPRAAISFWTKMREAGGARTPTFLSTHPAPDQRIEQIRALLPEAVRIYQARS